MSLPLQIAIISISPPRGGRASRFPSAQAAAAGAAMDGMDALLDLDTAAVAAGEAAGRAAAEATSTRDGFKLGYAKGGELAAEVGRLHTHTHRARRRRRREWSERRTCGCP
jgi:hypothetical protein